MGLVQDMSIPLDVPSDLDDLTSRATGDSSIGGDEGVGTIGAPAPTRKRDFKVERQLQTKWCWSAVTVSVADFYESPSKHKQCTLVNDMFGRTDCCKDGSTQECNRGIDRMDRPVKHVGHHNGTQNSALDFKKIQEQINSARPIVVTILWGGGPSGHAVVIDGYGESGGTQWVFGDDPWMGDSFQETLDHFKTQYGGNGQWAASDLTK